MKTIEKKIIRRKIIKEHRAPGRIFRLHVIGRLDQVRRMIDSVAREQNRIRHERGYPGQWVYDPTAQPHEITRVSLGFFIPSTRFKSIIDNSPEAKQSRLAAKQREEAWYQAWKNRNKKESPVSKKKTKKKMVKRPVKKPVKRAIKVKAKPRPVVKTKKKKRAADSSHKHLPEKKREKTREKTKTVEAVNRVVTDQRVKKGSKQQGQRSFYHGFPLTQIIRYCGSKGYDRVQTAKVLEKLKLPRAGRSTIWTHLQRGIRKESIPKLSKESIAEIDKIITKAPKAAVVAPRKKTAEKKPTKCETASTSEKKLEKRPVLKKRTAKADAKADIAEFDDE